VENVRVGIQDSFRNTIRGTDLIVGPRSSSLQLLLFSVFGMGSPLGNNMSHETYEHWKNHPAVAWTIPYSLGDSHRNFRVIGTTDDFYEHYRFRANGRVELQQGRRPQTDHEVVIGSEVAERLAYTVGSSIAVTHGLRGGGIMDHEDNPFKVVGILRRTFTPIDRSLYVTLAGIHAMHEGWEGGAPPGSRMSMPGAAGPPAMPGASTPPAMPGSAGPPAMPGASPPPAMPGAATASRQSGASARAAGGAATRGATGRAAVGGSDSTHAHAAGDHEETQVTAFFVGAKSRVQTLQLQREINTWTTEPLSAVVPGVALAEMWQSIGFAEKGLRVITFFVVAVGLLGMLVSLYSSLNARRREMAILRAIGAGPRKIVSLLVLESGIMSIVGCIAGVALVYALIIIGGPIVERQFGLFIPLRPLGKVEWIYIGVVCAAGFLVGFVPAFKAYRNTLADGLSIKL
jgi:putative ABC transport system permease protein